MILTEKYCYSSIGVRGLCESYTSYLDDYGISLNKASKIADSSKITGKQLIDDSVKMAWKAVLSDIAIAGFKFKGITEVINSKYNNGIANVFSFSINRNCQFEAIVLQKVKINALEVSDINFQIKGDGDVIYTNSQTAVNGQITFDFEKQALDYDVVDLTITSTGDLESTNNNTPFLLNAYLICDERILFCNYLDILEDAVKIKASAIILNNTIFNDRYNDLILYKSGEVAIRVSQLDSSLNLLNGENKINKKGLYQLEIEKLSIKLKGILDNYKCSCCFECQSNYKTIITLP